MNTAKVCLETPAAATWQELRGLLADALLGVGRSISRCAADHLVAIMRLSSLLTRCRH